MLKGMALAILMTSAAQAAPVTYACTLFQGQGQSGMFEHVDQVVIDTEVPSIELRVARTMGTAAPVNWYFMDRNQDGRREEFILRASSNGIITAAGMDGIGSYSFTYNSGVLLFGATYVVPAVAFGWECQE